MRDRLSKALELDEAGTGCGVDRILAAAFFRKRPLQAGVSAHAAQVIPLAERRAMATTTTTDGFLVRGGRR